MVRTRRAAALSALASEAVGAASRLTPAPKRPRRRRSEADQTTQKKTKARKAAVSSRNASSTAAAPKKRSEKASEQESGGLETNDYDRVIQGSMLEDSVEPLESVAQDEALPRNPQSSAAAGAAVETSALVQSASDQPSQSPEQKPSHQQTSEGKDNPQKRIDGALFDTLVESVAPFLGDLTKEQIENFVLHSCSRQLDGGGEIDPDKIANAVFSIDQDSAEWHSRLLPPAGIFVERETSNATTTMQDLRVLQVTMGHPSTVLCWRPRQITHTFTFDAGSSKVLSEVDRCIRSVVDASMQYMATDKQVPYLLLSPCGDVIVLTKELLKACPPAAASGVGARASCGQAQPAACASSTACPTHYHKAARTPRLHLVRKGMLKHQECVPVKVRSLGFLCRFGERCLGHRQRRTAHVAHGRAGLQCTAPVDTARIGHCSTLAMFTCADCWHCI